MYGKANDLITPAVGNTFSNWIHILKELPQHKTPAKYRLRAFIVGAVSFVSAPFQWFESLSLKQKINRTKIDESPVFILGHWRSGTTFLHNILCQDTQFGYITTLQSLFPHSYLTNPLFPYLTRVIMPPTRPMDDVKLYLESPQEEEMALVNYGPNSLYHMWHFPDQMINLYRHLVKFEDTDKEVKEEWIRAYRDLLTKATYRFHGRKLVLKNPTNTARIPTLLEIFPKAKFIHIYRNPIEVYASTKKLHRNVMPLFQLQDCEFENVRKHIIWLYKDMMQSYLRDRQLIPENNLVEMSYDTLIQQPMQELERVYKTLGLKDFEKNKPVFKKYLDQQLQSKKSHYELPEEEKKEIQREWAFAFAHWGN